MATVKHVVRPLSLGSRPAADDSGWKQVRGDVFRRPPHILLYSALIGTGTQLILLASIVILAALAGSLYVDRGAGASAGCKPRDGRTAAARAARRAYSCVVACTVALLPRSFASAAASAVTAVMKAAIVGYALTSAVSGFISGRFYRAYFLPEESPQWIQVRTH